jgi:hypothetical protein
VYQDKDKLKTEHSSEIEIFELKDDEALCVAGGPEVDNDPRL